MVRKSEQASIYRSRAWRQGPRCPKVHQGGRCQPSRWALGLKAELERHGVTVGISRLKDEDDPLIEEIREANAFAPDVAVECHNNAGGGDGFEVYRQTNSYAAESIKLAQCIEARVVASGQKSRGVKTRLNGSGTDYFGWCRQVKAPAVLCEGFFVDNLTDSRDYNTAARQQAFGRVYAWGVLDYLELRLNRRQTSRWTNCPITLCRILCR